MPFDGLNGWVEKAFQTVDQSWNRDISSQKNYFADENYTDLTAQRASC